MKIEILALIILTLGVSLHAASLDPVLSGDEFESFKRELGLFKRTSELESRIDNLSKKIAELRRNIDATHNRIECARKVMQVMGVACVAFLGVIAIDYAFKKHTKKKKIHKSLERLRLGKKMVETLPG